MVRPGFGVGWLIGLRLRSWKSVTADVAGRSNVNFGKLG